MLDGLKMLDCIECYQQIDVLVGWIMFYVGLCYYQNIIDVGCVKFMGDLQDCIIDDMIKLVFFSFEFNCIFDDCYVEVFVQDGGLVCYKFVFDWMCVMCFYQLFDEFE